MKVKPLLRDKRFKLLKFSYNSSIFFQFVVNIEISIDYNFIYSWVLFDLQDDFLKQFALIFEIRSQLHVNSQD